MRQRPRSLVRQLAPSLLLVAVTTMAHAQGTVDLSGAQNLMNTFKTFVLFAGGVICLGSLIFTGIKLMSGNFAQAIPGFFGALFGAAVIGWGPGWISSLTGQGM